MPPKAKKRQAETKKHMGGKMPKLEANSNSSKGSTGLRQHLTQPEWLKILKEELDKGYFQSLEKAVDDEIASGKEVFPAKNLVFNALNRTAPKDVKIVLLGQDPYHGEGQAMGLSFSVPPGVKTPPSLRNMYTELSNDIPGFKDPGHGCLDKWADQGVLLLNATLTVRKSEPNSHSKLGWQTFTDQVIRSVSEHSPAYWLFPSSPVPQTTL
ncbi:uracil-DNA glycosylase [Plakobranchus ocellatus]|uniref:Uracil-DNA glycosylase n=1 Tax=Plakobranchus ocellatus TaxID=259542 RepID=A0AAV4E0W3_9GAST|nr:uracil-DNA glycosylase [Plakobranchus ocellatus]